MMVQYQCPRFHLYHAPAGDNRGCPVCAAEQPDLTKTRGIWSDLADDTPPAVLPAAPAPAGHAATPPAAAAPGHAAAPSAAPAAVISSPGGERGFDPGATAVGGSRTVGVYAHLGAAVEPVVGWLVCVAGPEVGRDWRLVGGRNAIGRGEGMAVRLATDMGVSRDRHAVVSFDPRRRAFTLAPGGGTALVYCNGHEVAVPVTLSPYDRIEVGASTLVFVPLVGEHFAWGG